MSYYWTLSSVLSDRSPPSKGGFFPWKIGPVVLVIHQAIGVVLTARLKERGHFSAQFGVE
jgi:hypothetical protein